MPGFNFPINFTDGEIDSPTAGNAFQFSTKRAAYVDTHWKFLKDVDGSVYGKAIIDPIPLGLNPNIIAVNTILAFYANATTGNTKMSVEAKGIGEGESYNPASRESPVTRLFAMPATALQKSIITFAMDQTEYSPGDEVIVKVTHLGADPQDTLATNTLMSHFFAFLQVTTQ